MLVPNTELQRRALAAMEFVNKPVTQPVMLAAEGDVTAGALTANDAYDLELWKFPNGNLELVLFMKLQFFFEDGDGGSWSADEKKKFLLDWKVAIMAAWSGRQLKRLKNGKTVSLRLKFAIQEGGWMFDHWELSVTKIKAGTFRTSYVNPSTGNVVLDSEDLTAVDKGAKALGSMQRGAVHEFGHMLGLVDEYIKGSPFITDKTSVLNSGEQVRDRHVGGPVQWLDKKLKKLGIE